MKAKKLSNLQERKLLKLLKNAELIGNGSSRIVFIDPRNSNRIVKVAIGANSFRQNKLERKLWNSTEDKRLARIYEYGRFVIVMERMVQTFDEDSLYEEFYGCDDDVMYDAGMEVVGWLQDLLGETSDNYQIGLNEDGDFKAYDYGFDPEHPSYTQCGEANWMRTNTFRYYLDKFEEILRDHRPITEVQRLFQDE